MRCFIALDLPSEVVTYLRGVQLELSKRGYVLANFERPTNFHITVKFLGQLSEEDLKSVKNKLRRFRFDKFDVELSNFGVFDERNVKVIWVGLNSSGLLKLEKEIRKILDVYSDDYYSYNAHITIARVEKVLKQNDLMRFLTEYKVQRLKFKVDKVRLKESVSRIGFQEYRDLHTWESD